MSDLHGNEPLKFSFFAADQVASTARAAARAVEGQVGSRASHVSTAQQDFQGFFAELFATNADTAARGGRDLVTALDEVASLADELQELAKKENERRRAAREWHERQEARDVLDHVHDALFGGEAPPNLTPDAPPAPRSLQVTPGSRETPAPGTGGGGGGTSSARPADLRSFATGSQALDADLEARPGALRGKLSDFAATSDFGTIDASGVVAGFEKWLDDNGNDATWATTVADAFDAVGGENSVSTLSDAALAAALQSAGVTAVRDGLVIDAPQALGVMPTSGYSVDPVNTSTGNFLEVEHDVVFAGASASLRLTRTYNSLDDRVGVFGPGWACALDCVLVLSDDGARMVLDDGREVLFPRDGDGFERATAENRWLLPVDEVRAGVTGLPVGAVWVSRDVEGSWWAFTAAGTWLGSGRGPGTSVHVERDRDGLVTRLTHERGRWLSVEHVAGRIAVVAASDGRRLEYGYDASGRLVSATSAVGTRTYRWNDQGLVDAVVSEAGVVEAENVYDSRGRVVSQLTPHGRRVRLGYLPGRVTVVSDEDGTRSNTYVSDAKGRLVGVTDADDHRQSMSYDAHGNLVSVTERDGSVTVHAYDSRGRRVRTVTPTGADLTYGWDEHDRVTTLVTESGAVVSYEYATDVDRDPSVVVDPEGGRTELTWQHGLLVRAVDPTGVTVTCRYDGHGDLVATENATGDVATIERDHAGRPVVATSPSGARTTFTHDAAGLLVSRRDADGATWRYEHTTGGRVSAVVDPLGARTTLTYGVHGDLETTTDPLGRQVTRRFDDQGTVSAVVLPDGAEWGFAHDALSRLRQVTDPAGGVWSREYDAVGGLAAVVDPTGVRQDVTVDRGAGTAVLADAFGSTTVTFDEFGRPVSTSTPDGTAELTTFDRCGRVVELVDGEGALTRLDRDAAGRITAVTSPSGATTTYEYDACGRPCAAVDALGARTTLTYDADSRVVARTLPTGEVERTTYDACGRVLTRRVPGAGTARFTYDLAGRLTSTQDSRFGQRRFRYDAAGQLVEAVDGLGGVTRYEYDVRGRVVQVTDAAGGTIRRAYDETDRVTAVTDPSGRTTSATHDAAGRQLTQTDADGRTTTWSYDAGGRVEALAVDGRPVSTVRRDALARTLVVTDHTRGAGRDVEHELVHDRRGLLVRRSRGGQAVSWEHDVDGSRVARVDPDGSRTEYRHDAAGRVVRVTRDGDAIASFTWDAAGRLVGSSTGDLLQTWTYRDGALTAHTSTSTDGVRSTRLTRGADDRITSVRSPEGEVSYEHDAAQQLVAVHVGTSTSRWEYDAAGRVVAERTRDGHRSFEYDPAGQLVAVVAEDGARTEHVHDGLGRRVRTATADGAVTDYAWNDLGYLTGVTTRSATGEVTGRVEVWVDALGELAEVDGVPVWWDSAAAVPALVSVGNEPVLSVPGGAVLTGAGAGVSWRVARATDPTDPWGTGTLLPGLDALPDTVGVTATGGLTVAGLEWLGARVYDPAVRGFLSTDPLPAVTGAAWSGNPYAYAGNDPLHALDPHGLSPATDADLAAYAKGNQGAFAAAGEWWSENWEYVVAGVAIAGGVLLMFTGVGGPAGAALLGAASGLLISGGVSAISQKASTGSIDPWILARDASIGAVLGGAGAAAGAWSATASAGRAATAAQSAVARAGSSLSSGAQQALGATTRAVTSQAGIRTLTNAGVGGTGNVGTYFVTTPQDQWSLQGAGASFAGGAVSGGISSNAGAFASNFDSRLLSSATQYGTGAAGSVLGGVTENALAGEAYDPSSILFDATTGALLTTFPGAEALDEAPGVITHVGAAWAGQHAGWIADGTGFVLEQTGVMP